MGGFRNAAPGALKRTHGVALALLNSFFLAASALGIDAAMDL
jgi:hypothetical protein